MPGEHWFEYNGARLEPFYHMYNLTHLNERMVELAIARHWGLPWQHSRGLEVGNVTGHYERMTHPVLDLYELAAWYQVGNQAVHNTDLLELGVSHQLFSWVMSISTIEHTANPLAAIKILKDLVAPGGSLLVTFPTGVRQELDDYVLGAAQEESAHFCTISREDNDHGGWALDAMPQIQAYGPWANTVAIYEWTAPL